jgi:hypothetical protein
MLPSKVLNHGRVRGSILHLESSSSQDIRKDFLKLPISSHFKKQIFTRNFFICFFFRNGSVLLQVDVDHENGGMKLNEDFLVISVYLEPTILLIDGTTALSHLQFKLLKLKI